MVQKPPFQVLRFVFIINMWLVVNWGLERTGGIGRIQVHLNKQSIWYM